MQRTFRLFMTFFCFCLTITFSSKGQYADMGTGVLRNQVWWFDWAGFTMTEGATRQFVTDDGLNVQIRFTALTNPVVVPNVMNTWSGSVLHLLYNFSNPNKRPALMKYNHTGPIIHSEWTMQITATRDGQPAPFTLVAADAEASTIDEVTIFTTDGSPWTTLEFFRNSTQTSNPLTGCGTQVVRSSNTHSGLPQSGQNPILATMSSAAGQLSVKTKMENTVNGGMAVAYGIFSAVDRGDLPPSYGYAQHRISYNVVNGCNFMPPYPSIAPGNQLYLGNTPPDADNVQTTDDNTVGVDEEAIGTFPLYNGGGTYSLTMPVNNTTGSSAYLTGWFDSDLGGDFSAAEATTAVVAPNATTATLTWTGLPASLPGVAASLFGFRLRLTSTQTQTPSPAGPATDGEVEDYSITRKDLTGNDCESTSADFGFTQNLCNPLEVSFNSYSAGSATWDFGNGTTSNANTPTVTFTDFGTYTVKLELRPSPACVHAVEKDITVSLTKDDVILSNDAIICTGTTGQFNAVSALEYCWFPATGLSATNIANPTVDAPAAPVTYFLHTRVQGQNLIVNGDFEQGNTGFTSAYAYATNNTTEGQYHVSPNPRAWNGSMVACTDHTSGSGNMLLLNGSPVLNQAVWQQTVAVIPNTNYAFSTWIQSISAANPAQLSFSINGRPVGSSITAGSTCAWRQFFTSWNSGNATTAVISIVNQNTIVWGNDFALDDISFAPVQIIRDSVRVDSESPQVTVSGNSQICRAQSTQLSAGGAAAYSWSPAMGLSDATIANPVASPLTSTVYTVTGTTINGCKATDQVTVNVWAPPVITITSDTAICKNTSVQLEATGGITYQWTPATTLNNASLANPVASPGTQPQRYEVTVTDNNNCESKASVNVSIRPDPVFTISDPAPLCLKDTILLSAGGGHHYVWQPAVALSDPDKADTKAYPSETTTYNVVITDMICHESATLSTRIIVNPLPVLSVAQSNDIDCIQGSSQLNATGAVSFSWTPAGSLSNASVGNPVATPQVSTMYIVKGTDHNNCSSYDSIKVNVVTATDGMYLMPNGFTPNGDGINDCYGIKYWGLIKDVDFSVYNRWGERVFHTSQPTGCWDGRYKGQLQPGGVFVYQIKAQTLCGTIVKKGTFVLIR
ncbi:gliding motility-associated C-terminal domain-containing protein [Nostoc ellipsosporum NOK]|nr:gliding motility-associated C-terminal domain-containing protein [Nostoc ellipsosporum NOK]